MDAEDVLFLLYTSGTTGKPGIIHTTAGYMVYTHQTTKYIFDMKPEDVYWCTADVGWITGHSYIIYGPMQCAATQIIYEGAPDAPNEGCFWEIIEKYRATIFYTAPTAIRAFMKWGDQWPERHDLSSLRLLGTVGEPINPEAWMWFHTKIGAEKCPIVDTWWQTETGGHMLTPMPVPRRPSPVVRACRSLASSQPSLPKRERRWKPASSRSRSRGRACCAVSTATRNASKTPTGASGVASTTSRGRSTGR